MMKRMASALNPEQEEVSGIHTLSLNTIKGRRASLCELSSELKKVSSQARELVDSIDVPEVQASRDLPPPAVSEGDEVMPPEKLEQKLIDMSELIQTMAGPVSEALDEITKSRRSRWAMLAVFMLMMVLNMGVSVYVVQENIHLVERIELLQSEFKAHLITSGSREAQLDQLIKLAQEHASSDETREELRKLSEFSDKPSMKALEAAGRAVQQGVPLDRAVRQALTSTSHDASSPGGTNP